MGMHEMRTRRAGTRVHLRLQHGAHEFPSVGTWFKDFGLERAGLPIGSPDDDVLAFLLRPEILRMNCTVGERSSYASLSPGIFTLQTS